MRYRRHLRKHLITPVKHYFLELDEGLDCVLSQSLVDEVFRGLGCERGQKVVC